MWHFCERLVKRRLFIEFHLIKVHEYMCAFVVFDLDGTIVDTEYEIARFTADLAGKKGCPLDADTAFYRYAGVSFKDKFNMIAGTYDIPFSEQELADMHVDYTASKNAMYKKADIPTIDGAVDLVKRLASVSDNLLSLASSNQTKRSRCVLSSIDLTACFGDRVYGSDLTGGLKKPDPSIHLLAMKGNKQDAIIVEDSLPGVISARVAGAGLVVAYVDPRLGDMEQRTREYTEAGAHIVINTYQDFEQRVLSQAKKLTLV